MKKNFYKVLGVNQKADPEKIRRAYRRAVKRYHPDVSPRNEDKFREVQEAYETLSDPEKKALYDREIVEERPPVLSRESYYPYPLQNYPASLFDEIDQFFGRFEDLWTGRWSDPFGERDQSHTDLSVEITLTPSEARKGCRIPLKIPFQTICRKCGGTGFAGELVCGRCRGRGEQKLQRSIEVSIPPGVKSETEMRIPLRDPELRGIDLIATIKILHR